MWAIVYRIFVTFLSVYWVASWQSLWNTSCFSPPNPRTQPIAVALMVVFPSVSRQSYGKFGKPQKQKSSSKTVKPLKNFVSLGFQTLLLSFLPPKVVKAQDLAAPGHQRRRQPAEAGSKRFEDIPKGLWVKNPNGDLFLGEMFLVFFGISGVGFIGFW